MLVGLFMRAAMLWNMQILCILIQFEIIQQLESLRPSWVNQGLIVVYQEI